MHVNNSKAIAVDAVSRAPRSSGSTPADKFAVAMADELLRTTTWQYARWSKIRQNNEPKAYEIAKLILERHAYLAGKGSHTLEGRKHFDQLTATLEKEGIYLYRSHQFKKPIFPDTHPEQPEKNLAVRRSTKNRAAPVRSLTLALRKRFANKDCLEFLAGVLEDNGIDYYGRNGVARALIDKARTRGKSPDSYLTGEGVTHLLCDNPVTSHIPRATRDSFAEIWDHIKPHLRKGAILSYSSRHFGHTGIVDRVDGRWVYINSSGTEGDRKSYRVVEEDLKAEIAGWLRRARAKNTFLDVTIGTVDWNLASHFNKSYTVLSHLHPSSINLLG